MRSRTVRTIAIVASAALVLGAFVAAPAEAKKRKKKKAPVACATYAPAPPESNAAAAAEAPAQKVVQLTPAATEQSPVTVALDQGPGLWAYDEELNQAPLEDDTQFVNVQVSGAAATTGLYIRQEWASPSLSDLDLYAYDGSGVQVAVSGAFNPAPLPVISTDTGGMGFEQISGHAVSNCIGLTIESRTFATMGEAVTLKFWFGDVVAPE